jgi:hypothetical protein
MSLNRDYRRWDYLRLNQADREKKINRRLTKPGVSALKRAGSKLKERAAQYPGKIIELFFVG